MRILAPGLSTLLSNSMLVLIVRDFNIHRTFLQHPAISAPSRRLLQGAWGLPLRSPCAAATGHSHYRLQSTGRTQPGWLLTLWRAVSSHLTLELEGLGAGSWKKDGEQQREVTTQRTDWERSPSLATSDLEEAGISRDTELAQGLEKLWEDPGWCKGRTRAASHWG